VLYNKVLGGLEDKVVILKIGEDDNSWLDNTEVLYSTILGNPHQNISKNVTDLEILVVLVTRLLRRGLDRLVNGMEPVELWDEG
jgi:hypothetical protein